MNLGVSTLDFKLGARMLLKYPGLTVIGGLTLAVAIGLGAGWFEVTHQLLQPRLPLDEGDRIVRVENWDAAASELELRSVYEFQIWCGSWSLGWRKNSLQRHWPRTADEEEWPRSDSCPVAEAESGVRHAPVEMSYF
jgi:hypothetical protein